MGEGGAAGGAADGGEAGGGAGKIADPCLTDGECADGGICYDALPGGYCAIEPAAGASCPEGATKFDFDDGPACLKSCEGDGDCRDHPCHFCDEDKTCWGAPFPDDGVGIGAACATADDCMPAGSEAGSAADANVECLTEWDGVTFPGGSCVVDAFVRCCPEGTDEASISGETLYCMKTCTADTDCRGPEYTCSAAGFCFPP